MCHYMTQAERERWLERERDRMAEPPEEEPDVESADPEPEAPEAIPTPSD